MVAPIQRVGDFNGGGGIIVSGGHNNVLVNGRPAATPFALVTPHLGCNPKFPIHCIAFTLPASSTVNINGEPVIVTGVPDTCTHKRAGGSPNVISAGGPGLIGQVLGIYSTVTSLQNLAERIPSQG